MSSTAPETSTLQSIIATFLPPFDSGITPVAVNPTPSNGTAMSGEEARSSSAILVEGASAPESRLGGQTDGKYTGENPISAEGAVKTQASEASDSIAIDNLSTPTPRATPNLNKNSFENASATIEGLHQTAQIDQEIAQAKTNIHEESGSFGRVNDFPASINHARNDQKTDSNKQLRDSSVSTLRGDWKTSTSRLSSVTAVNTAETIDRTSLAPQRVDATTKSLPQPAIMELGINPKNLVLEKYTLYETKTKFYVIASNQADSRYQVLKIDRTTQVIGSNHGAAEDNSSNHHQPHRSTQHKGHSGLEGEGLDNNESVTDPEGLLITEDATIYSKGEIRELLETLSAGNVGGVSRVEPLFYGIAGFVRFTTTYYMILIKSRAPVALVGGHYIYHCEETSLKAVNLTSGGTKTAEETRSLAAFHGVDLSKNFYFSYTYDLTNTLQHNLTHHSATADDHVKPLYSTPASTGKGSETFLKTYNDKWIWNRRLLRPALRSLKENSPWLLPLIHGFVDQAKLSIFGRTVYITLIARRSRHFAGARFLRRGVNEDGYVANDVETEQIVSDALTTAFHIPDPARPGKRKPNPRYTSFLQVRGSIPIFWAQEGASMNMKPPIEITVIDPYYSAAALHFDDLLGRYGGPLTVLNLIKQKEKGGPRESKLLPEFKQCIDYLNQFLPEASKIVYIPWDISAANKQRDKDVIGILEDIAEESLESTGFFHSGPEPSFYAINPEPDALPCRSTPLIQSGVIRTNCIDCLDRTNAAQFVVAKAALGHQLHALSIIHHPRLPFDCDAVNLLTEMYHDHGDTIAMQYGGSHLVNNVQTYRKPIGQWSSHSRDMLENFKRYYANSFVDADKQAAIDLFLGINSPLISSTASTASVPILSASSSIANSSTFSTNASTWRTFRTRPYRPYRDWYTVSHLAERMTLEEAKDKMNVIVEKEEANYWQSYYRPNLLTEMARHFAFKMNSTLKYKVTDKGFIHIAAGDWSPFVPRLAQPISSAKLGVSGGVRHWISRRQGNQSKSLLRQKIQSQRIDEGVLPSSIRPAVTSTTETLVGRLLRPSVEPAEAREYESYINQFNHLSLSQDLSEKDMLLYKSTAAMARGRGLGGSNSSEDLYAIYPATRGAAPPGFDGAASSTAPIVNSGGVKFAVDRASLAIYQEAVKVAKAGQDLRGEDK